MSYAGLRTRLEERRSLACLCVKANKGTLGDCKRNLRVPCLHSSLIMLSVATR